MKIIICTYYDVSNYGAFLQAYSLTKYLEMQGNIVLMKQHNANGKNIFTFLNRNKKTEAEVEYKKAMKAKVKEFSRYFTLDSGKEKYDLCVIGSDEVWNVRSLSARHYTFFFRGLKNATRNITYAVCSGKTTKRDLMLFPYSIPGIHKLDGISVRDSYTAQLVKSLGIDNFCTVLDPTFLYNFKECSVNQQYGDYLFVYTYGMDDENITEILEYARMKRLKVVATGSLCEWADDNPIPNPFEWVSLIEQSACVVTTTFHGMALAIQKNKQFAVINPSLKMKALMDELEIIGRIVSKENTVRDIFDSMLDYSKIEAILNEKKEISKNFLMRYLQNG